MTGWAAAAAWGGVAGAALVIGAVVGWFARVPRTVIAIVMAFGSGVLISALAFDLALEAQLSGGIRPTVLGFLLGAVGYVAANAVLARWGAHHRKRSNHDHQPSPEVSGSGTAIAVGALLDGIPESVVLGLTLLNGGGVSTAVVAAVVISNLPEGLSSAAGMRRAGRSRRYVLGLWAAIAVVVVASSALGYLGLAGASPETIAVITAVAAGAILTMVADTMIPEAFERTHMMTGLVTTLGFLTAFVISRG